MLRELFLTTFLAQEKTCKVVFLFYLYCAETRQRSFAFRPGLAALTIKLRAVSDCQD